MKTLKMFGMALVAIIMGVSLSSCNKDENPVAGTVWEWSEAPITWTFTFNDTEVVFDYRGEFGPDDITTDQYKSSYTYTSDTVTSEFCNNLY